MEKVIGTCGCICSECKIFKKSCNGCNSIKGKACWLHEVGLEICDFYECAVINNGFSHCGECSEIPCEKFWANKNPKWSHEQHKEIVEQRVSMLKDLGNK